MYVNDNGKPRRQVITEKEAGVKPLHETNLESWYQLLVVLTGERTSRNYSLEPGQAVLTTGLAIEQLLLRLKLPPSNSTRVRLTAAKLTMLLASISLRCASSWGERCVGGPENAERLKERLLEALQEIGQSYRVYSRPLRQTLVALALGWIELVEERLAEDEAALEYVLGQACGLAAGDIEELREVARKRERKRRADSDVEEEHRRELEEAVAVAECVPATLAVCLVTRLLRFEAERRTADWDRKRRQPCPQLRQLVPDLLGCIAATLQKHPYAKFCKAALTLLGLLARSFCGSMPVDEEAVAKLWLALIPPNDIKNSLQDSLYEVGSFCLFSHTLFLHTLASQFFTPYFLLHLLRLLRLLLSFNRH
jgi:nuclear pore complex protein Nup188